MGSFNIIHRTESASQPSAQAPSPDLTVVVAIYNTAPYLWPCLGSLTVQGKLDLEIILVDYKSTDGSREIAFEFAKKFAHLRIIIVEQLTPGLGDVRNFGIEIARGTYIAFMDSDDIFTPDLYPKLVSFANTHDCDLVFCKGIVFENYKKISYLFYDNFAWKHIMGDRRYMVTTVWREPRILQFETNANLRIMRLDFMREHKILCPEGMLCEDLVPHFKSVFAARRIGLVAANGYFYRVARIGKLTAERGRRVFDMLEAMKSVLETLAPYEPDGRAGASILYLLLRFVHGNGANASYQDRREYYEKAADVFARVPREWVKSAEKYLWVFLEKQVVLSAFIDRKIELLMSLSAQCPSGFGALFQLLRHGRLKYAWCKRKEISERIFGRNIFRCAPHHEVVDGSLHHNYDLECPVWDPVLRSLRRQSPLGWGAVDHDNTRIDRGLYGHYLFTLFAGSTVVDVGVGTGVAAFRFATYGAGKYHVNAYIKDEAARKTFRGIAEKHNLRNLHFFGDLNELEQTLEAYKLDIDFLRVENDYFSMQLLQELIARHTIRTVYGEFSEPMASSIDLYRLCSTHVDSFYWYNRTRGDIVAGDRWTEPEVSVIVTARGDASCVARCLESLVHQRLERKEIIVVNNGMEPDVRAVVEDWQRRYPSLIQLLQTERSNCAAARSAGLAAARGYYVSFADSTDSFDADMLDSLYEFAVLKRCEVARCSYRVIGKDGANLSNVYDFPIHAREFPERWGIVDRPVEIVTSDHVLGRCIYRTDYLRSNKIDFPSKLECLDDLYFSFSAMSLASRAVSIPDVFCNHYDDSSDPKRTASTEKLSMAFEVFELLRQNVLTRSNCRAEIALKKVQLEFYSKELSALSFWDHPSYFKKASIDIFRRNLYLSRFGVLRQLCCQRSGKLFFIVKAYLMSFLP